jgi:hypothetical protein
LLSGLLLQYTLINPCSCCLWMNLHVLQKWMK